MFTDGLAEGDTMLGVLYRGFESGSGNAYCTRGDVDTLAFKPGHNVPEALAFNPSDQICGGNGKVLKDELAGFDTFVTALIDISTDGKSRMTLFDDKGAHSRVRWVRPDICLHKRGKDRSAASVRDPHFLAVQYVVITFSHGRCPQTLDVGTRVGLRQCQTATDLAGSQARKIALLLLVGSESREDIAHHGVRAGNSGQTEPTAGEFFKYGSVGHIIEFQTAVCFRNIGSK